MKLDECVPTGVRSLSILSSGPHNCQDIVSSMVGGTRASGLRKRRRRDSLGLPKTVTKRSQRALAPLRGLSYKPMFPVAKGFRTQLRYNERGLSINPGAGGVTGVHVFSANSLFDPDRTGVGHQPAGFDEIMALYDHFTVHGAKITVDFHNDDATNPVLVGIAVRDANVTVADPRQYVENGLMDYTMLSNFGNWKDHTRITMHCDVAKYLGRKNLLSDPDVKGSASANPLEEAYFHVCVWALGAVDASTTTCAVTIDYDVTFHERKMVGLS